MSKEPLISVIIPVYRVERFLSRCIDSVIEQTYKNLEIILVDDGSPDRCGDICDEYVCKDQRIKVIHKENGGVSSARNAGLDIAKGAYVTFIDSDDYWDKHYMDEMLRLLRKHDADIVRCDNISVFEDGRVDNCEPRFEEVCFKAEDERNYSHPYYRLACHMLLISRKLITDEIRFDTALAVGEDSVFVTQLLLNSRKGIVYTPQKLYYFVQHDDSSRYQKNNSLLEAFYIRQHLNLPEKVYQSWASDFAERCCIEYIALLKEGIYENKERMQQIVQYIKEYKTYGECALGNGGTARMLFRILCVSPKLFNLIYKMRYRN